VHAKHLAKLPSLKIIRVTRWLRLASHCPGAASEPEMHCVMDCENIGNATKTFAPSEFVSVVANSRTESSSFNSFFQLLHHFFFLVLSVSDFCSSPPRKARNHGNPQV
jgi:hypothetical protein